MLTLQERKHHIKLGNMVEVRRDGKLVAGIYVDDRDDNNRLNIYVGRGRELKLVALAQYNITNKYTVELVDR